MLVVKVELWPGGDPTRARELASMEVVNESNLADTSDYLVRVQEDGNPALGIPNLYKVVNVQQHERRQSVWQLIRKALEKI